MLTHNLLVTGGKVKLLLWQILVLQQINLSQGFLTVWDARLTEPLKIVRLGHTDGTAALRIIRQVALGPEADSYLLKQVGDTIVCSFGAEIRLVRFPMLADKVD
jgi:hypothetical protein